MVIEQIPLFFDKTNNKYFYVGFCACKSCDAILKTIVIIKHSWSKKNSTFGMYCMGCFNKQKDTLGSISEIRGARIVLERPENAYPVIIQPPSLRDSKNNETIFSMAEKNFEGEETIDNTRIAGRESFEGCQIGLDPEKVDDKKQVLSDDEADTFLIGMQQAKPADSDNKIKWDGKKDE